MMCLSDRSTSTSALSDHSTFTSTDARATDLRHCFFFWKTNCRLGACVFARAQALSPPIISWYQSLVQAKGWAATTRSKGGGTTARGHHLFPLRVRHYTRVGVLWEAPANDIGSRSYLRQDEAIGIVYNIFGRNFGAETAFLHHLNLCFESASVHVLFGQDVRQH
jgi:hypothetical protein